MKRKLVIAVAISMLMSQPIMADYDHDLDVLSHIISAEAGDEENCTHEHRVAVGLVVRNRVKSPDFPNTYEDVVFQPGQYSPTWNGSYYNEPTPDSVKAAEEVLAGEVDMPEDVVFQAEFQQGSYIYQKFETIYGITYICGR